MKIVGPAVLIAVAYLLAPDAWAQEQVKIEYDALGRMTNAARESAPILERQPFTPMTRPATEPAGRRPVRGSD